MSGVVHPCQTNRQGDEQSKLRTGRTCRTRVSPTTAYSSMPYRDSRRLAELRDAPVRAADPVRVTKPGGVADKTSHFPAAVVQGERVSEPSRPVRSETAARGARLAVEFPRVGGPSVFRRAFRRARPDTYVAPVHRPPASKAGSETRATDVPVRRETTNSNTPHDGLGSSSYSTISPLELHLAALASVGSSPAQAVGKSQAGPQGTRPSTGVVECVCSSDGGDV